jgi:hypothetical protein
MIPISRFAGAITAALSLAAAGCTSILGGIDFNGTGGSGGGAHTSSTSTTGTGGTTSTSSTGGGGTGGGGAGGSGPCLYYVDHAATGTNDGSSWSDAFTTVQPALDAAGTRAAAGATGCEVWVAQGTYYVYATGQGDTINLRDGVGLYGGFAGTETARSDADPSAHPTILDGHASATGTSSVYHVVTSADVPSATIDGFTVQGGNASSTGNGSAGGGILISCFSTHTTVTVSRCEVANNAAVYGAGISFSDMCSGLTGTVTDSFIHDNLASQNGGGMGCGGTCTVTGTTFQDNHAGVGGGLDTGGSLVTLTGDTFLGNVSTSDGGGLYIQAYVAGSTLSDLIFRDNHAGGIGGALAGTASTSVTVTNGLFVGNAASAGGAIADDSEQGFVCMSCTITGNHALAGGGHAILWQSSNDAGAPRLYDTIVWGNPSMVSPSGDDIHPVSWTAVGASHCDVSGYGGADASTFDQDPLYKSTPAFFDHTSAVTTATNAVVVSAASAYAVGDLLEIGSDGAGRAVSAIDAASGTLTFSPALATPAPKGTQVRDWGAVAMLPTLDLHLLAASPCVGAGSSAFAPADNLDGDANPNPPDIGAY